MMPGMGMEIAGSRMSQPIGVRLKSVPVHSIFGIGMYLTALLLEAIVNPPGAIHPPYSAVACGHSRQKTMKFIYPRKIYL